MWFACKTFWLVIGWLICCLLLIILEPRALSMFVIHEGILLHTWNQLLG